MFNVLYESIEDSYYGALTICAEHDFCNIRLVDNFMLFSLLHAIGNIFANKNYFTKVIKLLFSNNTNNGNLLQKFEEIYNLLTRFMD